jgi:hypothetical protein
MSAELATVTPMHLIQQAMDKGMKLDDLGKLFDLQERWEKSQAAKEYAAAISGFQAECPAIEKKRAVMNKGGGSERFRFAAWEDIAPIVNPLLAKYRIAISFSTPESVNPAAFTMNLRVQVGTHVEVFPFTAPYPDIQAIAGATYCSETQAVGTVNSYFKRYHFINTFNLTIVGADNEALLPQKGTEPITQAEAEKIAARLKELGKSPDAFLEWVRRFQDDVKEIGDIAQINAAKVFDALAKMKPNQGAKK